MSVSALVGIGLPGFTHNAIWKDPDADWAYVLPLGAINSGAVSSASRNPDGSLLGLTRTGHSLTDQDTTISPMWQYDPSSVRNKVTVLPVTFALNSAAAMAL